jgi:hypothetical protein
MLIGVWGKQEGSILPCDGRQLPSKWSHVVDVVFERAQKALVPHAVDADDTY